MKTTIVLLMIYVLLIVCGVLGIVVVAKMPDDGAKTLSYQVETAKSIDSVTASNIVKLSDANMNNANAEAARAQAEARRSWTLITVVVGVVFILFIVFIGFLAIKPFRMF